MKHTLLIIACTLLLTTGITGKSYAGGAGGEATEFTQKLNNLELVPINLNQYGTLIASQSLATFQVVLGPIANAIIANTLQTVSTNMISWISGGMEGNSLIQDPETFIKRQGLTEVRKALAALPKDNPLSNGIFNSVVGGYAEKDLETAMKGIMTSNIPNVIQQNICSDAQLTTLAKERVADANGNYEQSAMLVEKEYLYGYAGCNEDPKSNPDLAIKLMDIYKQRPELGGDAAWLLLTGGDNDFTKATRAESLVREKVETAKKLAENELFLGLGAISQTKCSVALEEDAAGNTFCPGETQVINPGKAVQSALNLASTAGVERLINITGEGSISSVLTGFIQQTLFKGLNKGVADLIGGGNNTPVQNIQITPNQKDLVGSPERKDELTRAIYAQLDTTLDTISQMEDVVDDYTTAMASYRNKVEAPKGCFDSAVELGTISRDDARAQSFYTYYNDRIGKISETQNMLNGERNGVQIARSLIGETRSQMEASQSSQEISNIYTSYRANYQSQNLPTIASLGQRKQSYTRDKSNADSDNEADRHLDTCRQLEQDTSPGGF